MEERIGDLLDCVLVEVEKIYIAVAAGWSDALVIEFQPLGELYRNLPPRRQPEATP